MKKNKSKNKQPLSNCSICSKALTDPISIEMGIGPVCRITRKQSMADDLTENMFSDRAEYRWGIDGRVLWFEDLGGMKSVTNDLFWILGELKMYEQVSLPTYQIMYKDSLGIWDGIRLTGETSFTFFPLTESDFVKAKAKLLATRGEVQG